MSKKIKVEYYILKDVPATKKEYIEQCECFLRVTERELERENIRHDKKVKKLKEEIAIKKNKIKDLEV